MAAVWLEALASWRAINASHRTAVDRETAPDANDEYLFYQTLLGAWPFGGPESAPPEGFVERVQGLMVKAACEAKRNTTWIDPDPSYKDALSRYVADILEGPDAAPFLNDFLPFQRRAARVAVVAGPVLQGMGQFVAQLGADRSRSGVEANRLVAPRQLREHQPQRVVE